MTQAAAPTRDATAATETERSLGAVLVADSDARLLAANRPACSMLGWSRIDLLLLGMPDVGVPLSALARVCHEADEHGQTTGTALLRHRDGRSIPVRYQVARVELPDAPVYVWMTHARRPARRSTRRYPEQDRIARAFRVTHREVEILQLIADGLDNRDIAQELAVSIETVKTHVRRLLGKLSARSRAHAVAIAWRTELVD
jgi:PAS domain S-box-containing protein